MNALSSSEEASPLQRFVNAHPWLFTLAWMGFTFPMSWLIKYVLLSRSSSSTRDVILETVLIMAAFVFLSLLGWWHQTGFTQGIKGEDVPLCLLPTLITCYIAFNALASSTVGSMIVFIAIYACLIAIAEESIFRGIILQTLLPKGVPKYLHTTFSEMR